MHWAMALPRRRKCRRAGTSLTSTSRKGSWSRPSRYLVPASKSMSQSLRRRLQVSKPAAPNWPAESKATEMAGSHSEMCLAHPPIGMSWREAMAAVEERLLRSNRGVLRSSPHCVVSVDSQSRMILRRNEAQGRSDSELPPETTGLEYWRAWQPEIRIGADTYSLDIFVRATGKATCAMTYDLPSEIYEMIYMDDEDEAEVNVAAKYDLIRFVVGQASALRVPAFGLVRRGPNRVLLLETFESIIVIRRSGRAPYLGSSPGW